MRQFTRLVRGANQKRALVGLLAGLLAVAAVSRGAYDWWLSREIHRRVFRIGVNQSSFSVINPDGSFGGVAVEMLKKAGERSGIALEWVAVHEDVDRALDRRYVDLWPLLTDASDRRRRFHLTDPWLENRFVLVVRREDSALTVPAFAGQPVAALAVPINHSLLRRFVPGARAIPVQSKNAVLQAVCGGEARAAFVDLRYVMWEMLNRSSGCKQVDLGVVPVEGAKFGMAVGSTHDPAAMGAAEALRKSISQLARDGTMAAIYAKWLLATTDDTKAITDLQAAKVYTSVLGWTILGLVTLLSFSILQVYRVKVARKAMEIASHAAERASVVKSQFLANMSHEIRTPMNGVIGMTELVLDSDLTPDQRSCLETVRESSDALLTIINDILDFSKIEAGCLNLDSCGFNLRKTLQDCVQISAARARQKGLDLRFNIQPSVPDLLIGDEGRLRQVLLNLMGNALKFTEAGEVLVAVAPEMFDREKGVCRLHFEVVDTGIGIEAAKQGMIFEAFAQADGSTRRMFGGTGLGLSISSQLVRLFRGRIWVESELGLGSTFHFTAEFGLPAPAYADNQPAIPLGNDNGLNRQSKPPQMLQQPDCAW